MKQKCFECPSRCPCFVHMDHSAGVGPNLASLWCRPAALENLDHNQVHININIPGPVRKAVDQNPSAYYFATVQGCVHVPTEMDQVG